MLPALIVRLRPSGPWRFGPVSGARNETELLGHSDTLYLALSSALRHLGEFDPWVEAIAASSDPPVTVSSLFPFVGKTLYVVPPRSIWPPSASSKVRWKAAKFVPSAIVSDLLAGKALSEDRWEVDPVSECVLPAGGASPFRIAQRKSAAVDRSNTGAVQPHSTTCLEFAPNAGLWTAVTFTSEEARDQWEAPLKAAFRFLADSGIGGERSRGWGRSESVDFQSGLFPQLILPQLQPAEEISGHWLLSLYSPAGNDAVDWSSGAYDLTARAGIGNAWLNMATEGSVIAATEPPRGRAVNVASEESPAYRSGFACSVPLPAPRTQEPAA